MALCSCGHPMGDHSGDFALICPVCGDHSETRPPVLFVPPEEYFNPTAWLLMYINPSEVERVKEYSRRFLFKQMERHFEQAYE